MSSQHVSTEPTGPHCPTCGAALQGCAGRYCWACGEDLAPPHGITTALPVPLPVPQLRRPGEAKGDAPLLGMVGGGALLLCFGLLSLGPGALILLGILATPALVRTVVTTQRRDREGPPADPGRVLITFLCSIGVVATVGIASAVAFAAICFPIGLTAEHVFNMGDGSSLFCFGVFAGVVASLAVAITLFRAFWRRKEG